MQPETLVGTAKLPRSATSWPAAAFGSGARGCGRSGMRYTRFNFKFGAAMAVAKPVYVQFGCGFSCPDGWLNFDASPTLRTQRLPLIGRLLARGSVVFPRNVRFGDIVKGLPVADDSASGVYASHVLEHLSRADFSTALAHTFRMLRPGGIFRLVVPDLEARARLYLARTDDTQANDWFMEASHLGEARRETGVIGLLRAALGNSRHLWMWDERAMRAALERQGFVRVRRCTFNDCVDVAFRAVERADRFLDAGLGIDECAMEAVKPPASA